MAKKSAKSKGFRRQNAKKPYLSKRDIALLCVLVAAVAIGAFLLFRYDDGALKVTDGAVVADGDNWLIVNGSNTRGGARYFKLGEIGEIEGYSREAASVLTDANLPEYTFTAETEDAAADTITVACSHSSAAALANYAASTLSGIGGSEVGEPQSAELSGHTVQYFLYTVAPTEGEADEAEAEEAANGEASEAETDDTFRKTLCGYIDAGHDSCVVFRAESNVDAAEAYPADDAFVAALEQAIAAVTLENADR